MGTLISDLVARVGQYGGHGIDHEDQPFHGELSLQALPGDLGVVLSYRATGIDGTEYHVEQAWIAATEAGELALHSASTAHPHLVRLPIARSFPTEGAERTLVFAAGDPDDPTTFRAQATLQLWPDDELSYGWRWGQPGEPLALRSMVRLRRVAVRAPWEDTEPSTLEAET